MKAVCAVREVGGARGRQQGEGHGGGGLEGGGGLHDARLRRFFLPRIQLLDEKHGRDTTWTMTMIREGLYWSMKLLEGRQTASVDAAIRSERCCPDEPRLCGFTLATGTRSSLRQRVHAPLPIALALRALLWCAGYKPIWLLDKGKRPLFTAFPLSVSAPLPRPGKRKNTTEAPQCTPALRDPPSVRLAPHARPVRAARPPLQMPQTTSNSWSQRAAPASGTSPNGGRLTCSS